MTPQTPRLSVLFVSGSPKSGTTWLQKVLDAHHEVACAGEGHFIEQVALPMAKVLRTFQQKLVQVDERVYQGQSPYPALTNIEINAILRDTVVRLLLRQAVPEGTRWVGDKTPRYTDFLKELYTLFPAARFIHVVRDPRDVAVSRLFHARRAGIEQALVRGSEDYYKMVGNSAEAWALHNGNVDAFRAIDEARRGAVHELTYEQLLGDFESTAEGLFGFLGIDRSADTIAAIKARTGFAALSGRRNGEEDATSFFRKGVVGDWRGRLDGKALDMIERRCGALMRAKGYA